MALMPSAAIADGIALLLNGNSLRLASEQRFDETDAHAMGAQPWMKMPRQVEDSLGGPSADSRTCSGLFKLAAGPVSWHSDE
jgi:hypothetical protein